MALDTVLARLWFLRSIYICINIWLFRWSEYIPHRYLFFIHSSCSWVPKASEFLDKSNGSISRCNTWSLTLSSWEVKWVSCYLQEAFSITAGFVNEGDFWKDPKDGLWLSGNWPRIEVGILNPSLVFQGGKRSWRVVNQSSMAIDLISNEVSIKTQMEWVWRASMCHCAGSQASQGQKLFCWGLQSMYLFNWLLICILLYPL